MSKALEAILLGTWSAPEGVTTVRRHLVMNGPSSNMAQSIKQSDAHLDTEVAVLRFMRDFHSRWYSPTEIHMNIKTKFSVGGLGNILRGMVAEGFLLVDYKSKNKKALMYKFNGAKK